VPPSESASSTHWLATGRIGDELPALVVNPLRHGRFEPRPRKRRTKQYGLMKKRRAVLRQLLIAQDVGD
jgi:hypothetical protein